MDYLEKILNARVYDVAIETPLEPASILSARIGNRIFFKREDMQSVFSFKLRGALMNFLDKMSAGWNITLFHYRNHGADTGRVLVGMEVPPQEMKNPAYRLFLG